jgi:hypothetical protein
MCEMRKKNRGRLTKPRVGGRKKNSFATKYVREYLFYTNEHCTFKEIISLQTTNSSNFS